MRRHLLSALAAARTANVVIQFADDLGYGHFGCYGQGKLATV